MRIAHLLQRAKGAMIYWRLMTKHFLLKPIALLLYGRKHVWIISERGTDARDNGYWFYRYMRENHANQPIYYIIDKNSADYPRIAKLGLTAQRGSLKHWLLYLSADVKISTHKNSLFLGNHWRYSRFLARRKPNEKIVFLQHGVTKDDMKSLYKENTNFSLFICGARPEYDYVLERFGYSKDEVKYTGFARFDRLHSFSVKRQILIMPTWRDWLSPDFNGTGLSAQEIQSSPYVQKWTSFLNSERLQVLAREHGVSFIFYPHYEMQRFLDLFPKGNDAVVIADFAHYDVQTLLKESMLLITDFSSVFFDFAYMQKPVLYYQFDEDEYRAHHYAQGYFDYRRDGFGEVVTEEAELLDLLEQYLENSCSMKAEYQSRIQHFFPLHDAHNCERIYHEIKSLS